MTPVFSEVITYSMRTYLCTAVERHLPFAIITFTGTPLAAAVVAAPIRNECDEKRDKSQPRALAAFFSTDWNW